MQDEPEIEESCLRKWDASKNKFHKLLLNDSSLLGLHIWRQKTLPSRGIHHKVEENYGNPQSVLGILEKFNREVEGERLYQANWLTLNSVIKSLIHSGNITVMLNIRVMLDLEQ